ncbi:dihydrofolate reductase [Deinococcus sp. KSM4-11]|uniref:dihydrofolate reductase family protein n=1 Tax=Deinococcus sp. KSM4-11 TaxID=2568654 RepID=UPI0010A3212B|nr:dihydrofolate reductase family protein [Deinococcus sp. KSM4-11]THF84991.1 dihydrofolate reductase [Deinococcus sp. KSM4-11]
MRRLTALERVSVDGIFDAAQMAVWDFPYDSEDRQAIIAGGIHGSDAYLLGRVTYEMLAPGWSACKNNEYGVADQLNRMKKYVVSSGLEQATWNNSTIIRGEVAEEIGRLKEQAGGDILVHGSATLLQTLLAAGLVDELQLLVHPRVVGTGKRLFEDGVAALTLELVESRSLDRGVVLLRYQPEQSGH